MVPGHKHRLTPSIKGLEMAHLVKVLAAMLEDQPEFKPLDLKN